MSRILGAFFILAPCALLAWTLLDRRAATNAPEELPAVTSVPIAGAATELAAPASTTANAARAVAAAEVIAAPMATPPQGAKLVDGKCELRGRFLLPGGAPAAGVDLKVQGWQANQERVIRFGVPDSFEQPTGSSGADGRFWLRFDPPRAFQFVLEGNLAGYCEAGWRWSEIEPNQIVDVGDVELVRGGSIRGRIVDSKGRALIKGWSAHADGPPATGSNERQAVSVRSDVDPASGEFLLDGLPPGRARLKAYARIANWIDGPSVEVKAGEEVRADIPYAGPDNESRIVLVVFSQPFYTFSHDIEAMTIRAPGFDERKAVKIEHSSQSFAFDDLPPGSYTVEIRDPRFLPWSRSGVAPGTSIDAKLRGNAAVALRVVDDATDEPVTPFTLDVRIDGGQAWPSTFRVLDAKDEMPRGGLIDGLVPHDQTLIVHALGYADCEVPAPGLAANEQRPLVARLTHGRRVSGTVVSGVAQKTPVEGAEVDLAPGRTDTIRRPISVLRTESGGALTTKTGVDGSFEFRGIAPGEYSLSALVGPNVHANRPVVVALASDSDGILLELPPVGRLAGRILAPDGTSFERMTVQVKPAGRPPGESGKADEEWMFRSRHAGIPIGADGTFRSPLEPATEVQVLLKSPDVELPQAGGSTTIGGPTIDLGTVVLAPDVDTQREFDLRATFPSPVSVRVRVNGKPGPGLVVALEDFDSARMSASGITDAMGACQVGPVPPNRWRAIVFPAEHAWVYVDPHDFSVKSGAIANVDVDVVLFDGAFTLVDAATHKPLAETEVSLSLEGTPQSAEAKSNAEGRVKLSLPAGRWRVGGHFFGLKSVVDESATTVDWGPSGPAQLEVALTPRQW